MVRRKTNEEYVNECKQLGIDLPIEEYKGTKTKIKHKCSKCGNVYYQRPNHHLNGQGCPICGKGVQRKANDDYVKQCINKGYDLPIEPYINSITPIKHKCKRGHIYKQTPGNHINKGQKCPYCVGNKRVTPQKHYQQCKDKNLDFPIEPYVNARTKIKYKCKQGHIYEQTPYYHLNGGGCPYCYGNNKKTTKQYKDECIKLGIDLPIEEYVNAKTPIKHKCREGHIYKQTPDKHLQGRGCPYCSQSYGEQHIQNYLDKHNIVYESQKTFNKLKDVYLLSYDFYLPEQKVLIEYQGQQHFESVSFDNKSKSDIQKQKYHDKLKRGYAKKHNYTLLEPTYKLNTQARVNEYLDKHLHM